MEWIYIKINEEKKKKKEQNKQEVELRTSWGLFQNQLYYNSIKVQGKNQSSGLVMTALWYTNKLERHNSLLT